MKFKIKTLLFLAGFVAIAICIAQWCRTDSIIHTSESGIIILPSGRRLPTNTWFKAGPEFPPSFLATDITGEYYLVENDTSKIAVFESDGTTRNAIVERYRIHGPTYRGEFWIRSQQEE